MKSDRREPPSFELQRSLVSLLRGEPPSETFDDGLVEACLRRYECGGYLHGAWRSAGRSAPLSPAWAEPIARAHRKTAIDNLGALAEFRAVGDALVRQKVPFVLLKGSAYLIDLYDDPGERPLTDIDLLLRPEDVHRVARYLAGSGYQGSVDPWYPESRRFEMVRMSGTHCRFEFHWQLGLEHRLRIDQDALWAGTRAAQLEGVPCRVLRPEDALLYHVGHLADHYFGPSLKWILDLRRMLSRWEIDPGRLVTRAADWRVRIALYLAFRHLEKLFPQETRGDLMRRLAPGSARLTILDRVLSDAPAELMQVDPDSPRRFLLRPCLLDSMWDSALLSMKVLGRPASRLLSRLGTPVPLPWEPSK